MANTVCHFSPLVQRMYVCGIQVAKVYMISEPTGSDKRCVVRYIVVPVHK